MDDFLDSLTSTASDVWNNFNLNQFINTAAQAYATVVTAQNKPTPGTVKTLPDGSVARVNADGTLTVITPAGAAQTVGLNGQIYSGTTAGVPNVLLLGGAAVLLLMLLSRRR